MKKGETRVTETTNHLAFAPQLANLERLLEEEIAALEQARFDKLDEFARRKSRVLSALTRAAERAPPDDAALNAQARRLRDRLEADARLLRLHLAAAEEVAEALVAALEDGEWDGTYQPHPARAE